MVQHGGYRRGKGCSCPPGALTCPGSLRNPRYIPVERASPLVAPGTAHTKTPVELRMWIDPLSGVAHAGPAGTGSTGSTTLLRIAAPPTVSRCAATSPIGLHVPHAN